MGQSFSSFDLRSSLASLFNSRGKQFGLAGTLGLLLLPFGLININSSETRLPSLNSTAKSQTNTSATNKTNSIKESQTSPTPSTYTESLRSSNSISLNVNEQDIEIPENGSIHLTQSANGSQTSIDATQSTDGSSTSSRVSVESKSQTPGASQNSSTLTSSQSIHLESSP